MACLRKQRSNVCEFVKKTLGIFGASREPRDPDIEIHQDEDNDDDVDREELEGNADASNGILNEERVDRTGEFHPIVATPVVFESGEAFEAALAELEVSDDEAADLLEIWGELVDAEFRDELCWQSDLRDPALVANLRQLHAIREACTEEHPWEKRKKDWDVRNLRNVCAVSINQRPNRAKKLAEDPQRDVLEQFSPKKDEEEDFFVFSRATLGEPSTHSVGVAHTKGQRREMEDAHTAFQLSNGALVRGVFDGHGGTDVSTYCANRLQSLLEQQLQGLCADQDQEIDAALRAACTVLKTEIGDYIAGTTATVMVLWGGITWVVQVGDSRALAIFPDGLVQTLTEDASLSTPRYTQKVTQRGGQIRGGLDGALRAYGLNTARGIEGGKRNGIVANPKITRYKFEQQPVFFVGCDGVFEQLTNAEVGRAVAQLSQLGVSHEEIADVMVRVAVDSGSEDNITAMVFGGTP